LEEKWARKLKMECILERDSHHSGHSYIHPFYFMFYFKLISNT
jgi:hypothetical protein